MLLLIDNYDSFVYNLARYVEELGHETFVVRNDAIRVDEVRRLAPDAIVISPGPCTPSEAGVSLALIREFGPHIPMLGVCLGHQAIAQALGGRVIRAAEPVHGRTALVQHHGERLFAGLPNPLTATRYHSLIVEESSLPKGLEITARTPEGIPMALEHNLWPLYGVQFHPESILTDSGHRLLANFLAQAGLPVGPLPAGDLAARISESPDPADVWWATEPL
ncbi:MAG TPA: aminodeoxychorismate/anthranilate synthase component II [Planctomycetaceae bacterium]|nr:aminodeoxychorismate/anthranilate synthase component II [Planctomycetaceae bacterium]